MSKPTTLIVAILSVILIILVGLGVFYQGKTQNNHNSNHNSTVNSTSTIINSNNSNDRGINSQNQTSIEQSIKKQPDNLNLKTMFLGDVFWGRYVDDWSKASTLKYTYPFSGLNTFERDKYDAWIGGLECPITEQYIPSSEQDNTLSFNCLPEYLPEAAKWFNAFTLANNHTDNMEKYNNVNFDGFDKTRKNLDKYNLQYFGHFDNNVKSDICEVISLYSKKEEVYIPIAMCGFHNVFKLPTQEEINVISQYSKYLPTIVMPHQGKEYSTVADSLQRNYAKAYIDAGADAVIGNHVHVNQDSEVYKNKLIIYSLGNFIFDQQNGITTQAIALDTEFNFINRLLA
jgi:Bacterial capsule synthesis protein PGA_cap